MENKFLCCSHNSTHNDHWFTFNFLLHCCSMHRPEGASYLGVRPPLDRPQLCWWLPQLSQILPTAPLRVPPPPHPAGTAGQTAVGISRRQLLILLMPDFCHSRCAARTTLTWNCNSTSFVTPLKRSADGRWSCAIREVKAGLCLHPPPLSLASLLQTFEMPSVLCQVPNSRSSLKHHCEYHPDRFQKLYLMDLCFLLPTSWFIYD